MIKDIETVKGKLRGMKILIIRNYPTYMDVENNTYNIQEVGLAKALVRKGNEADILFWTDREEKIIELPVENCGAVRVYYKHGKTFLKNTVYSCDNLFNRYDILQAAEYNQIQSWSLAKRYPQKTIVYHGPYYSSFNKRYNLMCAIFDKFFLKRYIDQKTHFMTKSKLAKDFLVKKGISNNNVSVVGVGIDTQMLSLGDQYCEEPIYIKMKKDDNYKILYIGRFEHRRNIPFILEVFKKVIEKHSNTTLYMIGLGEKKYMDFVWKKAEQLGVSDNIVYQPKIEQKFLAEIYRMADFFLLPTFYEIFGMVLLEAMYYETIILTSINGGSSTLIQNDVNGIVFENFFAEEWSKKINELTKTSLKMRNIKENAHNTIAMSYTWDKLAEKFEEKYKEIGK